jgi:predicted transcriptional regulator
MGNQTVEQRTTVLKSSSVKLQKMLIICILLSFLLTATARAAENVRVSMPADQFGVAADGEQVIELETIEIPYWQFLLWLVTMNVLAVIDLTYFKRLIFTVAGYRIVDPGNVLENPSRSRVYTYIKTKPGAYISEIVEQIGLDRGTVKYHIKTLKAKNKIEAYKDGGKIRYFENFFTYNEDERKVISALQNVTNQRIISEIINGKCDTNVALAREFGVSRATISWYIKNLREVGLIMETKEGRSTTYKINNSYQPLVERHVHEMQDPFTNEWI